LEIGYRHALVAGAALLVSHGGSETASAATEFRTTTTSQSGASLDVLFAPVADATELVSVSDGSVFTGEGGSLVVSAITDGNQIIPLTASIPGGFFNTLSLFDMTQDDFTAFPAQTITGIRFTMAGFDSRSVTIPSGTQFTFTTIPEPQTALLIGLGLLGLAARGARRSL
jgi:hypothetical protein